MKNRIETKTEKNRNMRKRHEQAIHKKDIKGPRMY